MPDKHEVGGSSPLGPTSQNSLSFEMQNSKCKMQNEGSKMQNAELSMQTRNSNMKFLWLPFFTKKVTQMFIENRIKKKETKQIVVY